MPMTNQEFFTQARRHLLAQGRPSQRDDGMCMYRGPGGLKCAVGALIPDELYQEGMEGLEADILMEKYGMVLGEHFRGVNVALMLAVQLVHDNSADNPEDWARLLEYVAADWGLEIED